MVEVKLLKGRCVCLLLSQSRAEPSQYQNILLFLKIENSLGSNFTEMNLLVEQRKLECEVYAQPALYSFFYSKST